MCHYSTIDSIIDRCPHSFELRDNQGRNFLHILVQPVREINFSRYSLIEKLLLSLGLKPPAIIGKQINLDRYGLKKIVNERDNKGNTPLHWASMFGTSTKIMELIEIQKADTTVINNEGKTALDHAISQDSFSLMARSTLSLFTCGATFGPQRQDKLENWKNKELTDKTSKNMIVVSVLIATIALSAAFNVPGSYNGDGIANLRLKIQYNMFIVFDTIAMSASVAAVMLLVLAKAFSEIGSKFCFILSLIFLWISLFTMGVAFVLAVSVTLGHEKYITKFLVYTFASVFFFITLMVVSSLWLPMTRRTTRKFLSSMKEQTQTTRQIGIQFPTLTTYIRISSWFIGLNYFCYFIVAGFMYGNSFFKIL
ncbi:Ankyrin repeat family protein-like [Rhynchospora pubera]|uniref:Ankyrin repeat family protein-like n=1 Tax=Rhynchospora pubera TaxID=906938 RepID=A0AAV8GDM5_9POAL|nr:Ankyrin repeat family protein-like [Rhynchospora pubera]